MLVEWMYKDATVYLQRKFDVVQNWPLPQIRRITSYDVCYTKLLRIYPRRILTDKYRNLGKTEILEKTGCVVGMRNIDIEVKKGEFFILMGLSGSGKSTLIRNIIRLVEPTAGTVEVLGEDVTKMGEARLLEFRKTAFGMVFQHYGLFPHMTVLDNAAYALKVQKLPRGERYARAMQAIETVGLKGWEDQYPGALSGGMQQRVGLARALASDPDILLMDEPFSGLDPLIRRQMQDELVELQAKLQKTIVFVTHDLHEALKLGHRIAIMRNGEVVQIGTAEDIVTAPADDYVAEFVQDASPAKVITAGSIMSEPAVLLYAWEGPKTALTILKREKRQAAFVVVITSYSIHYTKLYEVLVGEVRAGNAVTLGALGPAATEAARLVAAHDRNNFV